MYFLFSGVVVLIVEVFTTTYRNLHVNLFFFRSKEKEAVTYICNQLVHSIRGAIQTISTSTTSCPSTPPTIELVTDICRQARTALKDYAPWSKIECSLKDAVNNLTELDLLFKENTVDNERQLLVNIGKAKCYLGNVMCQLFTPAPVDPMATASTEFKFYLVQVCGNDDSYVFFLCLMLLLICGCVRWKRSHATLRLGTNTFL